MIVSKSILTSFVFLILSIASNAQTCGTEVTERDLQQIQEIRQLIGSEQLESMRDFGDSLIPVAYHIIAADDSTMGLDTALMYAEMDTVALRFAAAGMYFYQCGEINYYYNDDYVDFEKNVDEDICDTNDVPDVLNIWFADNVFSSSGSICGYAYLSGSNNRTIIDNDCADNSSTLAHEIGHYFSLLHTHSSSGGDELVDGSNCSFAGDYLCNTPADPNVSGDVDNNCFYVGSETDSNGHTYMPDTRNIMSYSRKACRDSFSFEQNQQMAAYLVSYRNYLNCQQVVTGVEDAGWNARVQVYPNPSTEEFKVRIDLFEALGPISVDLIDPLGRVSRSEMVNANSRTVSIQITDLGELSGGIYTVRVSSDEGMVTRRVIIN